MSCKSEQHRFWFDRFQVSSAPDQKLLFRDWLTPPARLVSAKRFAGLAGVQRQVAFFQRGFMQSVVSPVGDTVRNAPLNEQDKLFWQFPCRTEGAAWDEHRQQAEPILRDDCMHVYLGLPWATWIDVERKNAWGLSGAASKEFQLQLIRVRLSGLRHALAELGITLRVHTVCQHIYWQDMSAAWRKLGVTDLWLSHCPQHGLPMDTLGFQTHPWSLYAVNVRDQQRRTGLTEGKDPAAKTVLASFVGAHAAHYPSDVRLRLRVLAGESRFVVRITDSWHFENVVYAHQIGNAPLASGVDGSVASYNSLLSDSVFSLCPAGAGPNTLRLWESLAVGSIPVLLGPVAAMPKGGNLPAIEWDECVVRIADEQIKDLPRILNAIPMERVRKMQRSGMAAYELVRKQRCYEGQ